MQGFWTRKYDPLILRRYTPQSGIQTQANTASAGVYEKRIVYNPTTKRVRPKGELALFRQGTFLQFLETDLRSVTPGTITETNGAWTEVDPVVSTGWSLIESNVPAPNRVGAKTDVLNSARGFGVNLALMLAEYREAAALATQLARMVLALSSPKRVLQRATSQWHQYRTGRSSLSEHQSNLWLMWQYGITPTYNDLNALINHLKTPGALPPIYKLFRGSAPGQPFGSFTKGVYAPARATRYVEGRVSTRAKLLVTFPDNAFTSTFANLGFTNLPALVFERIPLSFVADWVSNIGDSIASLDNPLVLGYSAEISYEYRQKYNTEISSYGGLAVGKYLQKVREQPVATSTFVPLQYKPSLSAARLLSAVTLTRQRANREWFLIKP